MVGSESELQVLNKEIKLCTVSFLSPLLLDLHQRCIFFENDPHVHFVSESLITDLLHVESGSILESHSFCDSYSN